MPESTLSGNGIYQGAFVDFLNSIVTKWNLLMTKLDADTALTDNDYVSANSLSMPEGIQTDGMKAIRDEGQVHTLLDDMVTEFNAVTAKLDADTLVGLDNDYASTLDLTDFIGERGDDGVQRIGEQQGSVVYNLHAWLTNYNLLLAKLDADPLDESDYASTLAITDTVDETDCKPRPGNPL